MITHESVINPIHLSPSNIGIAKLLQSSASSECTSNNSPQYERESRVNITPVDLGIYRLPKPLNEQVFLLV